MFQAAAAFQSLLRLSLVRDETVDTGAQKSLKARLSRVVINEVVLLKSVAEKLLSQVLRILVISVPLEADVFVDRLPIAFENRAEGSLTNLWLFTANPDDC